MRLQSFCEHICVYDSLSFLRQKGMLSIAKLQYIFFSKELFHYFFAKKAVFCLRDVSFC